MRARWRATNRRGQVVFRFRPKGRHGFLPGDEAELPRRNCPRPGPLALDEDVGATAEDECVEDVAALDSAQRRVLEVDRGVGPGLEAE